MSEHIIATKIDEMESNKFVENFIHYLRAYFKTLHNNVGTVESL